MEKLNHIEIEREKEEGEYRFRSNPNTRKPPIRDQHVHGVELQKELSESAETIYKHRNKVGIDSDNLMVFEVISNAMSSQVLEDMLNKFDIYLVEETDIADTDNSKLLIQYKNKEARNIFDHERELWQNDSRTKAILTYKQRQNLFNCIDTIRYVSRQDRTGERLQKWIDDPSLFPEGFFSVDIDVWFNGDCSSITETEAQLKHALGNQGSEMVGDLLETPSLLLGRARVNEFSLNALLDLDIIAMIELPNSNHMVNDCKLDYANFEPIVQNDLDSDAPLAAVLDSGIFTGNPLLNNIVIGNDDFDHTEGTTTDLNGHGTGVAGIVAYGDFTEGLEDHVFKPLVRLCNGKIMHDNGGNSDFAESERPEKIVKEAIETIHQKYGCRIFNLSVGDEDHLYTGGRQFAWAELLDQLSRDLDIVIIVSAGNVSNPDIKGYISRDELLENCRDQLFDSKYRLIDPATSALSVTVGSITRFDDTEAEPYSVNRIQAGKKNYMSVFTRIGKGVNKSIKPELVDYGGNFSVSQIVRGQNRWMIDKKLAEPTLTNQNNVIFIGRFGTSFSAPHVTHIAARIEKALEEQLNEKPSANLIRAVLINSAKYPVGLKTWAENSKDIHYKGKDNPKQDRRLRLVGYGKADDSLLYSDNRHVTLIAEDELKLRSFHLYKIPVPKEFLKVKAEKSIVISMAYNPRTRLSRKEYLTNNLQFEVFRKIEERDLVAFKAKRESGTTEEDEFGTIPNKYKADFKPGYTTLERSTVQQRIWAKGANGGSDLLWDDANPYIYIMITGKECFQYDEQDEPQEYALVITFSFEGKEDIELYNLLRQNVRIKEHDKMRIGERERARTNR